MSLITLTTCFGSHRDLEISLKKMVDDLQTKMDEPDGLILITGTFNESKKKINDSLKKIHKFFPKCQMIGTQQQGVFTYDMNRVQYGIRAVAGLAWKGFNLEIEKVNRIRLFPGIKGKKYSKRINNHPFNIFFPPGIYYPPSILKPLRKKSFVNPLSLYNSNFAKHQNFMSPIFAFIDKMQNIFNMGIPYSSIWSFIENFRKEKDKKNFAGAFGINTDSFNKTYQFMNWRSYSNDLIIGMFPTMGLKFGVGFGVGVNTDSFIELPINKHAKGGIVIEFGSGKNKKPSLNANQFIYNALNIDSNVWQRNTESNLGLSVFHPFYINHDKNDGMPKDKCTYFDELDKYPSLYFFMANKNMKSTLGAIPDQVIKKLSNKEVNGYLGNQSTENITSSVKTAINMAKMQNNFKKVHAGIFIECSNRAQALEEQFTDLLNENVNNTNFPFLGLITSGEIAPRKFPIVCSSLVSILLGE